MISKENFRSIFTECSGQKGYCSKHKGSIKRFSLIFYDIGKGTKEFHIFYGNYKKTVFNLCFVYVAVIKIPVVSIKIGNMEDVYQIIYLYYDLNNIYGGTLT